MKPTKKKIEKAPARSRTAASATSILGRPVAEKTKKNGEVKIKPQWQKFYNRLLELREQLLRQMNGLAKESAQEMAGYSLHMADSGTDNFDRDFALSEREHPLHAVLLGPGRDLRDRRGPQAN